MARRVKFISKGSGLDVQLELRKPGDPYAALVAADWPEDRTVHVVAAPTFGAYAFMQRDLADELDGPDLGAVTSALGMARVEPRPITRIDVEFPLEGPVQWSEPTSQPPTGMPQEAWAQVVERLHDFDHAQRERQDTERTKFRSSFERRATKLLPSMCGDQRAPAISRTKSLTHKIWQGTVQLKRGDRKVGRYYPSVRVLILIDEEERAAAIDYLRGMGEDPLPPVNSDVPRLLGQVNFFEDHFFVVYSERTHKRSNYATENKIAVYNPTSREMLSVVSAWSDVAIELLEAHGLRVEREIDPAEASGSIYRAARRLTWDKRALDPVATRARDERSRAKLEQRLASRGRPLSRPAQPRKRLSSKVEEKLPEVVATAVKRVFEETTGRERFKIGWDADSVNWSRRTPILNQKQLDDLAASLGPIALPPSSGALVERARQASPAHAPLLTATWLREFEPAWFASLPWEDRELPARGRDGIQAKLEEMSDRQVAQSAQPQMLRLLMRVDEVAESDEYTAWTDRKAAYPGPDLDPKLTQNDVARLWLAVAAMRQEDLVQGWDVFERRTCLVCQRAFPVGILAVATVNFTRSDKVCRWCADLAYFGISPEDALHSILSPETTRQALGKLAQALGSPPTRAQLSMPLMTTDDGTLATQVALRMILPSSVRLKELREAEVLPEAYRPSRGVYSIANDGHECRSLFERHVDDFLSAHGIAHEVEPPYPRDDDLNNTGLRGDWLLPGGTFVEAAGLTSPAYLAKIEIKQQIAARHGLDLIILTTDDLGSLEARFARWLNVK